MKINCVICKTTFFFFSLYVRVFNLFEKKEGETSKKPWLNQKQLHNPLMCRSRPLNRRCISQSAVVMFPEWLAPSASLIHIAKVAIIQETGKKSVVMEAKDVWMSDVIYLQRRWWWSRSLPDCLVHTMPVETAQFCYLKHSKEQKVLISKGCLWCNRYRSILTYRKACTLFVCCSIFFAL